MARATDYRALVSSALENLAEDDAPISVASGLWELRIALRPIATRLHDHDGWCDWDQIWEALVAAGRQIAARRRRGHYLVLRRLLAFSPNQIRIA